MPARKIDGWVLDLLHPELSADDRKNLLGEAEQRLLKAVTELETLIAGFSSFDLLANLTLSQLLRNPETYKEHLHHGDAAIIEYVALLALKSPYEDGRRGVEPFPLDDIIERARQITTETTFFFGAELLIEETSEAERALVDLQFRALSTNMMVRSLGYPHHLEEDLRALFSVASPYLISKVGFDAEQALGVEAALENLFQVKLAAANEEMARQLVELEARLFSGDRSGTLPRSLLKKIQKSKPSQRKLLLRQLGMAWLSFGLGKVLTHTTEEITKESGLPADSAQSLLRFFSVDFQTQPPDYKLFVTPHELQRKPLIHHKGKYFYALPGSLRWALKQGLESILNPDAEPREFGTKNVWARYDERRARYLEDQALTLICSVLPGACRYQELNYKHNWDGKTGGFELDGLIQYGETLFLVEAKAGAASPVGGPRGRGKLKNDVKKLIGSAHEQGLRAQDFIQSSASPVFVDKSGCEVHLDKNSFSRIILIAVSLESLDVFNGSLHALVEAGLLEATDSLPWSVSIGNLKVVCEHIEFPSQFIDYVTKRLDAVRLFKVYGQDELDWLSDYMNSGLCFEHDRRLEEADRIMLDTTGASVLDDYYSHLAGDRETPGAKLAQAIPFLLKQLLLEVEARSDWPERTEAVLTLLHWGGRSRDKLDQAYADAASESTADGKIHMRSFADDQQGVTIITTKSLAEAEALALMPSFIAYKKYAERMERWTGFVCNVERTPRVQALCVLNSPWQQDEQKDKMVRDLGDAGADPIPV